MMESDTGNDKTQKSAFQKVERGTIWANWEFPGPITAAPLKDDYRDHLPPSIEEVQEMYAPVVENGSWTFGLWDMWGKRAKFAKQAVHVPCWDSFRLNPCLWRGSVCGRTCHECYWLGLHQTRWARSTYAASLGREYNVPCSNVPEDHWRGRIVALCWFDFCIAIAASAGFGQFVAPGGQGFNFAACYDCHAREKLRRKYNLPTTFGLPPALDDCCVHFLCMYCASHQEMRELAVRGVDGPGLHVLDVSPDSFKHVPGWEQAVAAREARREYLKSQDKVFLPFEARMKAEPGRGQKHLPHNLAPQPAAMSRGPA